MAMILRATAIEKGAPEWLVMGDARKIAMWVCERRWLTSISSNMVLHEVNSFMSFLVACRSFFSCFSFSLVSVRSAADDAVGFVVDCGDVGNDSDCTDDGVDGRDKLVCIGIIGWSSCWWFGEVGDTDLELEIVADAEIWFGEAFEWL